jgi:glycosyltransferase involved in cell wall biosynthesis
MNGFSVLGLERPPFGQFARQVVCLRTDQLAGCLQEQSRKGGRLGEILRDHGLITRPQIAQVLGRQASWVARTLSTDLASTSFPFPAFFSLCMPAYNEQGNIEDTLDAACAVLPHFVTDFEIVVVDDGSRDATADLVGRYSQMEPRVRLVRHERNRGYGAAVASALRAAHGDLIAFTDSDGQFSLLDLPLFLTRLDDFDVVIGYRHRRADPRLRLFNAWGWNWVIRLVLGVWVKDLDCAFKLFRKEVLDQLQLTSTGATINAEILAQCFRRGVRIREIPVTHWPRYAGRPTGANLKVIVKAFLDLPRIWKYRYAIATVPVTNRASAPRTGSPATEPELA